MDTFEQMFCDASGESLSLIPGRIGLRQPISSILVRDVAEYLASDMLATISAIPNVHIEENGTRSDSRQRSVRTFDWWKIRWQWRAGESSIKGDFTLLEE